MTFLRSAIVAALLLLDAATAAAELTVGTPAPEFPRDAIWLNGQSHAFSTDLKGKVVLVDFWEYTCINCIRTFPHLKQLYARYHKDGFEIIGVHKGEFAFASQADKVRTGYGRLKLPYPAIADVKDLVWNLFKCWSWPDSFLIYAFGRTVVLIDESRMYYLVAAEDPGRHELRLFPTAPGGRICSFTFGNRCEEEFDRL